MRDRIKALMASLFELGAADIPDEAQFGVLKGWDSLGHIALMMAVESEFGVELTTQSMQDALTLPALEDFISQALKAKHP